MKRCEGYRAEGYAVGGWRSASLEVGGTFQRAEGSGQKAEDRRQKTEDRGQRTEDRGLDDFGFRISDCGKGREVDQLIVGDAL